MADIAAFVVSMVFLLRIINTVIGLVFNARVVRDL